MRAHHIRTVVLGLLAAIAAGCGPKVPQYPEFRDRNLYLCCTMRFNKDRDANDANYVYDVGTTFRAGTPVRIAGEDRDYLRLQFGNDPATYRLGYRYGRPRLDAHQWYALILRDSDPTAKIAKWPAAAVRAVDSGTLAVGLTKTQALTARGYPPFHRTESLDGDTWLYYTSPNSTETVQFTGGKVASITAGGSTQQVVAGPLTVAPFTIADEPRAPARKKR